MIRARYESVCLKCSHPVFPGEMVHWVKGRGVSHLSCPPIERFEVGREYVHYSPRRRDWLWLVFAGTRTDGTRVFSTSDPGTVELLHGTMFCLEDWEWELPAVQARFRLPVCLVSPRR